MNPANPDLYYGKIPCRKQVFDLWNAFCRFRAFNMTVWNPFPLWALKLPSSKEAQKMSTIHYSACLLVGVCCSEIPQRQASQDQQECKNVLFRQPTFDPVIVKSNTAQESRIQIAMVIRILITIIVNIIIDVIITTTIPPLVHHLFNPPKFDNTHAKGKVRGRAFLVPGGRNLLWQNFWKPTNFCALLLPGLPRMPTAWKNHPSLHRLDQKNTTWTLVPTNTLLGTRKHIPSHLPKPPFWVVESMIWPFPNFPLSRLEG